MCLCTCLGWVPGVNSHQSDYYQCHCHKYTYKVAVIALNVPTGAPPNYLMLHTAQSLVIKPGRLWWWWDYCTVGLSSWIIILLHNVYEQTQQCVECGGFGLTHFSLTLITMVTTNSPLYHSLDWTIYTINTVLDFIQYYLSFLPACCKIAMTFSEIYHQFIFRAAFHTNSSVIYMY